MKKDDLDKLESYALWYGVVIGALVMAAIAVGVVGYIIITKCRC